MPVVSMFQPAMVVTPTTCSPCFIGRMAITGSSKFDFDPR